MIMGVLGVPSRGKVGVGTLGLSPGVGGRYSSLDTDGAPWVPPYLSLQRMFRTA